MSITKPTQVRHRDDAVLDQNNPVSGTKYTVLATTRNVRILSIAVKVTWTVQPTPLEAHITIDGVSITHTLTNPASGTWYFANRSAYNAETGQLFGSNDRSEYIAFLMEGRSVKIEVETTGGTVSNLSARVKYATK